MSNTGGPPGVLLGVLLIACGLLLWLNPAHSTFYAIAAVVLAVLSFIASNFGGFFIGMLLGIIGGSMGFGWTPSADRPARRPPDPPGHGGRMMAAVLPLLLGAPITLTPGSVVTVLLQLMNSLTPLVPVTMTNVTTDDFLVASDSLQANDLDITSG